MTFTLDCHDFSFSNNNMFYVSKLRDMYPDIKFSMFFIPADLAHEGRLNEMETKQSKDQIAKAVNEGWIELIPHGLMHLEREFENASYEDMEAMKKAYDEYFGDWGIPYIKGFCAPQWLYNAEVVRWIDDNNWWLAVDRNQPQALRAKRSYVYNHSINEPFPKDKDLVKSHCHISLPSQNALDFNFHYLSHIPPDATFKFVSQLTPEEMK